MALRKICEATEDNRVVKVHWDSDVKEYRCRLYVDGKAREDADYFTSDEGDARDTCDLMIQNSRPKDPAPTRTVTEWSDKDGDHTLIREPAPTKPVHHDPRAAVPIPAPVLNLRGGVFAETIAPDPRIRAMRLRAGDNSGPVPVQSRNKREGYYIGKGDGKHVRHAERAFLNPNAGDARDLNEYRYNKANGMEPLINHP